MGDIKKHWKVINSTLNKTSNKEDITTDFLHEGHLIRDVFTNATNINKYTASIGKETNESVGRAKQDPKHYLHKYKARSEHEIIFSDISAEDVNDVCRILSPKTSTDSSDLKQNVVFDDSGLLAPVITHMINCSMRTGTCPANSKLARVIPVYKLKGNKQLYEN